jgi:hypothetical protein
MTSSIKADTLRCPDCNAPMRLTRVLPSALPKDCGTENRGFFRCTNCWTTVTRALDGQAANDRRTGLPDRRKSARV